MNEGMTGLTACYLKGPHDYVGFVQELPHVSSRGRTLEEAREQLRQVASVVFEEERRNAVDLLTGKEAVRERFVLATDVKTREPEKERQTQSGRS